MANKVKMECCCGALFEIECEDNIDFKLLTKAFIDAHQNCGYYKAQEEEDGE